MLRNLPSVVFIMLALVTTDTYPAPVLRACSNPARRILSVPWEVATQKSMARSSVTLKPSLPRA